jgi:hypothetical protein
MKKEVKQKKEKRLFEFNANEPEFTKFGKIAEAQNRTMTSALNNAVDEYIEKYKGMIE